MKKVLITGIYGLIGNAIYRRLLEFPDSYDVYGLARRAEPSDRIPVDLIRRVPANKFYLANLVEPDKLQAAIQDKDVVVHMAADPSGSHGWGSVLDSNIVGVYNVFEASRIAGVQRVVFASSIQVSFGYMDTEPYKTLFAADYDKIDPADIIPITKDDPPRTLNLYSCSKVFGESLAHMYAHRHNLSCINLRIGWVIEPDRPPNPRGRNQWSSQRDIAEIVRLIVDAPDTLRYDTFYGVSDNRYNWVDIDHAREVLGYVPQDSAEDYPD